MCESTVGLSSETDASFYDAEAFELHIQAVLYSAGRGGPSIDIRRTTVPEGGRK